MEPKHLQLKVNAILLENTVARGKDCIQQIRRRYVKVEVDEEGREVVRIRGNVHKKTMQGRADDFKPLDVVVHGQAEVLQKCALSILIFVLFQLKINFWTKIGVQNQGRVKPVKMTKSLDALTKFVLYQP